MSPSAGVRIWPRRGDRISPFPTPLFAPPWDPRGPPPEAALLGGLKNPWKIRDEIRDEIRDGIRDPIRVNFWAHPQTPRKARRGNETEEEWGRAPQHTLSKLGMTIQFRSVGSQTRLDHRPQSIERAGATRPLTCQLQHT